MSIKNKVILVTGAASGIGKRIVEIFAQANAIVAIADLDYLKAKEVCDTILSQGGKALPLQMDVTNEIDVNKGVEKIIQTFGAVDVLISNAGIQHIAPVDQISLTDWKKMIAVHLDGAFLTTKACLQSMYSTNNGGCIIYIGSVHSKEASVLKAPYVTAKHGLEGLCKVVAKEGGPKGVRANMICPGFVRTPLVDKQIPEQAEKLGITEEEVIKKVMLKDTVDGQFTTLDDVAKAALFLASFESNALTGQSLVVSHGWFMQ